MLLISYLDRNPVSVTYLPQKSGYWTLCLALISFRDSKVGVQYQFEVLFFLLLVVCLSLNEAQSEKFCRIFSRGMFARGDLLAAHLCFFFALADVDESGIDAGEDVFNGAQIHITDLVTTLRND